MQNYNILQHVHVKHLAKSTVYIKFPWHTHKIPKKMQKNSKTITTRTYNHIKPQTTHLKITYIQIPKVQQGYI
jgi:hypothetical protein